MAGGGGVTQADRGARIALLVVLLAVAACRELPLGPGLCSKPVSYTLPDGTVVSVQQCFGGRR